MTVTARCARGWPAGSDDVAWQSFLCKAPELASGWDWIQASSLLSFARSRPTEGASTVPMPLWPLLAVCAGHHPWLARRAFPG